MPVQHQYFYGVPTSENANQIIKDWNRHIDRIYDVKRDLGSPQGDDEVCLALQILINFKVAKMEKHDLMSIAKRVITANLHLLHTALCKMYFELTTSPSQRNELIKILETDIPPYFGGDRERFKSSVRILQTRIETYNDILTNISDDLKNHIQFPYEFEKQTGLLTIKTKGRAAEEYKFFINLQGMGFKEINHDSIHITAHYKDHVNQFIAFKIIMKFMSEWFNEDINQYENITIKDLNLNSHFESLSKKFTLKNDGSLPVMRDKIQQNLDLYTENLEQLKATGLSNYLFWIYRNNFAQVLEEFLTPIIEKIQPGSSDSFELIAMVINHLCKTDVSGLNRFSYEFLRLMSDKVWSTSAEKKENYKIQFDIMDKIQFAIVGKKINRNETQGIHAVHTTLQYLIIGVADPRFLPLARHQAVKIVDIHSEFLPSVIDHLCKMLNDEDQPEFIARLRKIASRFTENHAIKMFLSTYSLASSEYFLESEPANKSISNSNNSDSSSSFSPKSEILGSEASSRFSESLEHTNQSIFNSENSDILSPFSPRSEPSSNGTGNSDLHKRELIDGYVNLKTQTRILEIIYQEKIEGLMDLQFDEYCKNVKDNTNLNYKDSCHLLCEYIDLKNLISKNNAYIYKNQSQNHPVTMVNHVLNEMTKTFEIFKNTQKKNPDYIKNLIASLKDWHEKSSSSTNSKNTKIVYETVLKGVTPASLFSHTIDEAITIQGFKAVNTIS